MTPSLPTSGTRYSMRWRMALWAGLAALLLLPLFAMQFTSEVNWTGSDFMVFGAMLLGAGLALEITLRMLSQTWLRALASLAILAAFLAIWASLAVGLGF